MSALVAEAARPEAAAPFVQARDVAVVDVGSNSVRLVVYRLEGRAIWSVFNEKVLAGLGRDVASTGRLNPEGLAAALAAVRRFRAVLDAVRPAEVFTAATAAVREASDGPEFVARVQAETGLSVRVLSGAEEAHYAALGVVAGAPDAHGLVGDLGGSSLELSTVRGGLVSPGVTLPLGPFALGAAGAFDPGKVRAAVGRRLERVDGRFRARTFYAVGGAWRNLALLQMRMTAYPLHIVHGYSLSAREALDVARFVARQSKASLERTPGMSKKRIETLPYAAIVLESLIERLGVERIELSAFGVREGLLFEAMPPLVQAEDPLVAGCAALGARHGLAETLGPALEAWLAEPFARLPRVLPDGRERVLIAAACRLADIGARLHPDHRAELVFDQVLRAPIAGQSHSDRAFLAVAAFARYDGADAFPDPVVVGRLLGPDALARARALGAALRLGCHLSGRSAALLARARLEIEGGAVALEADPEVADMLLGEQTRKRLNTLAAALDLLPVMRGQRAGSVSA